jgi:hypothetical protein
MVNEVCGLVNIQDNTFERNQGINSQTIGGAVVTTCDFMNTKWKFFSSGNDGSRKLRTKINYLSAPVGEDKDFYTYVYSSLITGNHFEENLAGQSGTALYMR